MNIQVQPHDPSTIRTVGMDLQRPALAARTQQATKENEPPRSIDVHFHYLPDFYREVLIAAGL
jgi:hypothetical protein